jgi:WD40 repeat protein
MVVIRINKFSALFNWITVLSILLSTLTAMGQESPGGDDLRLVVNSGHVESLQDLSFSHDGKLLASMDRVEIKLWDSESGKLIRSLTGGKKDGRLSFSLNGELIAIDSEKGILIKQVKTGKLVRTIEKMKRPVFSPDGKYLLALRGGLIKILDATTFAALVTLEANDATPASNLDLTADGKFLASAHENTVKLWNLQTRTEVRVIAKHAGPIVDMVFSPNGKSLLSCDNETVRLWDVATGVELQRFIAPKKDYPHTFYTVAFSPDGQTAVAGSINGVFSWDAGEGSLRREFETGDQQGQRTDALAFSPDGERLVAGMLNGEIRFWNNESGVIAQKLTRFFKAIDDIAFSPDGKTLFTEGSLLTSWDLSNPAQVAHYASGNSLSLSRKDKQLLAQSGYSGLNFFDAVTGKPLESEVYKKFASLGFSLGKSVISPDGKFVIVIDSSYQLSPISIYDLATGTKIRQLEKADNKTDDLAIDPDSKLLASAEGRLIKIADLKSGKPLSTIKAFEDYHTVKSLAFNPSGDLLAVTSYLEQVKLWNIGDGKMLRPLADSQSAETVSFSSDGKLLIGGMHSGEIKIWRVEDGGLIRTLPGHLGSTEAVVWSPNQKFLLSGGSDGKVKIWEVASGALLAELVVFDKKEWIVLTPDNRFDASEGAFQFLHFVENGKIVPLETFAAKFRISGLLKKILNP